MLLHVEFGLSVSDDTIYRALKDLGFSHLSARPKAYKQDAEAMDAFKKTLPYAWRKVRSLGSQECAFSPQRVLPLQRALPPRRAR